MVEELLRGALEIELGQSRLIRTQQEVRRGWQAVSVLVVRQGHSGLAGNIRRYVALMPSPKAEKEALAESLMARSRNIRARDRPDPAR